MKIHISDTTNSLLVNCSDIKYVTEERTPSVMRVILQQQINITQCHASLNESPSNCSNWPSFFWRPFLLVTVHEVYLYGLWAPF